MAKLSKIIARTLLIPLEWIFLLLIISVFVIRLSPVQTYLAQKATSYLSKELGTKISLEKLEIILIDRVDLKGLIVMNQNQTDTIAKLNSLMVGVNGFSSFTNQIRIKSLEMEGGIVKISKDSLSHEMNLKFILDYFKSDKQKKASKPLPFYVDKINIENVRFHYDDFAAAPVKIGMDYKHLMLYDVTINATGVAIWNGVIKANIRNLTAKEKSGIHLENLTAWARVSPKGIRLTGVNIKTPETDLNSKQFKLNFNGYGNFSYFIDSVSFDADIHTSRVSMADIAIFAPQLYGMDQVFEIEGKFSKFVKDLRAEEFVIKTGERTELRGNINLPDFRVMKESFYSERIDYAFIDFNDLQRIKMPNSSSSRYIDLSAVKSLVYVEAEDLRVDGLFSQFVLSSDEIKTAIGSVNMDNGIMFTYDSPNNQFLFNRSEASEYDIKVNSFDLGKFLNTSAVGVVDGTFFLSGEAKSFTDIKFTNIEGNINRFDLADYSYSDIEVKNTSFIDKVVYAEVTVDDKNLHLDYKGTIDMNGEPKMVMEADLSRAFLGRLNLYGDDSTTLVAKLHLDVQGLDPNKMHGRADLKDIIYIQGGKMINIPSLALVAERGEDVDNFTLTSSLVDAKMIGNVDFKQIGPIIEDQISHLLPGISALTPKEHLNHSNIVSNDHVDFSVNVKDLTPVLDIFLPQLQISSNSTMIGVYDAKERSFQLGVVANKVMYNKMIFQGINLQQRADSNIIAANWNIDRFQLNDSIALDQVNFIGNGNGEELKSKLTWNPNTENASSIEWATFIESDSRLKFIFEPSFFTINTQKWDIQNEAKIVIDSTTVQVENLKLHSGEQNIHVNGLVSTNDEDHIRLDLSKVDLSKVGQLLGLDIDLKGEVNGWGQVSNPYKNLSFLGDLNVLGLEVDSEPIGDVYVGANWDNLKNVVQMNGDLLYRGIPTFEFEGTYDVAKEDNNLDFDLVFDKTNIAFLNAFMDPLVIDDIRGYLNGKLDVTGSISRPIIEGKVELDGASAIIAMFGTSFSLNGAIIADEDGFYINHIPLSDAEGNTGSLTGSIYHNDYKDWNFDVAINVYEDYYKRDKVQSWVRVPLDRFLVMNTDASSGDLYYGKAYVTGTVGIFGHLDNLDINVNMKTQRGTAVDLDLFAQSDLSEDDFIEFINHDTTAIQDDRKIDFTGVTLNLGFDLTADAQIKLIINRQTGDEITAFGEGKIDLRLDNFGQMALEGVYTVREGSKYNFVLGPIKETFYVVDGGTVTWTGDPMAANLNIQAYNKVRANLGELSPEMLMSGNQEIQCYLNLREDLMKPVIEFDIKAPKAPEQDKTLLNQLTSDQDELNRQFFSLLLWKKFQPIKGSSRASGGAALDLASSQINALLGQLSQDYTFNVQMNADNQGRSEYEVGVKKGFLNDQLIVSGSFGTRNSTSGSQTQSSIIGDVEIEYKLNKDGTFRINVFNHSNDNRTLQSMNRGQFKQGIGIYYRESFSTTNDFKLLQQFLDIFRKKGNKRYPIRRKKQQTPVPKGDADVPKNENTPVEGN